MRQMSKVVHFSSKDFWFDRRLHGWQAASGPFLFCGRVFSSMNGYRVRTPMAMTISPLHRAEKPVCYFDHVAKDIPVVVIARAVYKIQRAGGRPCRTCLKVCLSKTGITMADLLGRVLGEEDGLLV